MKERTNYSAEIAGMSPESKPVPPGTSLLEKIRAQKEGLPELQKLRENKIRIDQKMNMIGKAFRDMGIVQALADSLNKTIETTMQAGTKEGSYHDNQVRSHIAFDEAKGEIESISQIIEHFASEPKEGRHFEFRLSKRGNFWITLWNIDDAHNVGSEVMFVKDDGTNDKHPLFIDLLNFDWDDSTPEGLQLIHAIEEAFPESADFIKYNEKSDREKKEEEAEAQKKKDEEEKLAKKNATIQARIEKLQKELKG